MRLNRPLGDGQSEPDAARFELLEDYGPAWYSQDAHERAAAALLQCLR